MKTEMENQEAKVHSDTEKAASVNKSDVYDWENIKDDAIMQQQSAIHAEEAVKIPFVGDKEPLSSLTDEYKKGSPIIVEKNKVLTERYAAIRRSRGDGNCFFRSFMFAYLEYILESQDRTEVHRVRACVDECGKTLQNLGYAEFTYEDFFSIFLEQLESVLQENEASISLDELVEKCRDQSISDYGGLFYKKHSKFVTSGEIRKRSEFFEPFILGLSNATVEQFCKSSVEPMGEESDHVHITALSDALGVPIRVVYLDRSSCENGSVDVNHHDFVPGSSNPPDSVNHEAVNPFITLLYRPGHYDILYKK